MDPAIIEKEALQLSEAQRALLADRLMASISPVPPELRAAWVKESDERMEAFKKGELSAEDGPDAMAKLRAQYKR